MDTQRSRGSTCLQRTSRRCCTLTARSTVQIVIDSVRPGAHGDVFQLSVCTTMNDAVCGRQRGVFTFVVDLGRLKEAYGQQVLTQRNVSGR